MHYYSYFQLYIYYFILRNIFRVVRDIEQCVEDGETRKMKTTGSKTEHRTNHQK